MKSDFQSNLWLFELQKKQTLKVSYEYRITNDDFRMEHFYNY